MSSVVVVIIGCGLLSGPRFDRRYFKYYPKNLATSIANQGCFANCCYYRDLDSIVF